MKNNISNLAGPNIYLDKYENVLYYNIFNKKAYLINSENEQVFRLFYYRYFVIFVVLVLLGDYFKTLQNTLLVGIGTSVVVELYYRLVFFNKLKVVKNFNKENKISRIYKIIKNKEKDKAIMSVLAYTFFAILIVINAIQQNFNIIFMILSLIIALYSIYLAIINIIAILKMKNIN